MSNPVPDEALIKRTQEQLKKAYSDEEAYWKQLSRSNWLSLGEKNTGYFHAVSKRRRKINALTVIEHDHGQSFHDEVKIGKAIAIHYRDLFTSVPCSNLSLVDEVISPSISLEVNGGLIEVPSREEIWRAFKDTNPDEAPGPDGFSVSFFVAHWDTVGDDVTSCIQTFFREDIMEEDLNLTHVRLIPKITAPK